MDLWVVKTRAVGPKRGLLGPFIEQEGCGPGVGRDRGTHLYACPWVAKVLSVHGPVEFARWEATPDGSAAAGRPRWRAVESGGRSTLVWIENSRLNFTD
jgi:hypothetical protein